MKRFGVRFYKANFNDAAPATDVSAILQGIYDDSLAGKISPQLESDGCRYEIRELLPLNNGAVYRGVLAVVRDDAPHIRAADGGERVIDLEDDEGIIEKNYFLFFSANGMLVWQVNGRASHVFRMELYLSSLARGSSLVFDDIININSIEKLRAGTVKRIKVRIALPKNAEAYDPNDWEAGAFEMMAGADATTMEFEIATRRRGRGLLGAVKPAIHRLLNRNDVRALRVKLDGQREFVDLLADCITDNINVQMIGFYPEPTSIFAEMDAAKERQRVSLEAYFGEGANVLV